MAVLLKFSSKFIFGSFNFSFLILTHLVSTFDLILKSSIFFLVTDEDVVALTGEDPLVGFLCICKEVLILVAAEDVLILELT